MEVCNFRIIEIKKISQLLSDLLNFDLSDFTYVNLKIKLEQFCKEASVTSFDLFLKKIKENTAFRKDFLEAIFFDSYELFRDPAMWRIVKKNIISSVKQNTNYRVLFPSCYRGSELVSFLILREELALTKEIEVFYTSPLDSLNQVKNGFLNDKRKQDLNMSNYKRIAGKEIEQSYFIENNNRYIPVSRLFENTVYYSFDERQNPFIKKANLIIYRNKLINYNPSVKEKIIENLVKTLKTGSYLITGIKENLQYALETNKLAFFDEKEKIYIKKL